ncbi:hypothetical protein TURU_028509 [Turdus rufiventris]|nr:hypothetical protein TURU_028509 [Turdus rufiventris]
MFGKRRIKIDIKMDSNEKKLAQVTKLKMWEQCGIETALPQMVIQEITALEKKVMYWSVSEAASVKSQSLERENLVDLNVLVELVWIEVEKSVKSNDRVENVTESKGASGKLSMQKVRNRTSDLYGLDLEKALFNLIPSCSWIDGPMMPQVIKVTHDCETCAAIKQAKWVKPLWYGGRWSKYKYGEAWQIDYITLPQTCRGKRYMLTMVEATTEWLETASCYSP